MCSIDPLKQKCSTRRLKIKRSYLVAHVGRDTWVTLPLSSSSGWHCMALTAFQVQLLYISPAAKGCSGFFFPPSLPIYSVPSCNPAVTVPVFLPRRSLWHLCSPSSNVLLLSTLGFSFCAVRADNLPCSRFFSQEVPGCSESHPIQIFLPVSP